MARNRSLTVDPSSLPGYAEKVAAASAANAAEKAAREAAVEAAKVKAVAEVMARAASPGLVLPVAVAVAPVTSARLSVPAFNALSRYWLTPAGLVHVKKGKSAVRYALHVSGETVADFELKCRAAGFTGYAIPDLKWGLARGFYTLEAPVIPDPVEAEVPVTEPEAPVTE